MIQFITRGFFYTVIWGENDVNLCIVGTGYVGLVTGACLAEQGNNVWCVDIDEDKISRLNSGEVPIYEPGLDELLKRNLSQGRIKFTTNTKEAVSDSFFVFIAVGTPLDANGRADIRYVTQAAQNIGSSLNGYKIIVIKSTVPVGTTYKIKSIITNELKKRGCNDIDFDVACCPEFLKEGSAVDDFLSPDRIVIGTENDRTFELLRELFSHYVQSESKILSMDITSAELTKYAANCMLATRISFMNEIGRLCDKVGADIEKVRIGIGMDPRIGPEFLRAGLGYGGSCLPKDVKAMIDTASVNGINLSLLKAVDDVNSEQNGYVFSKVQDFFVGCLEGVRIALWGLSFKPNTDDVRESQAVAIAKRILENGGIVRAYDPVATENARKLLGEHNIIYLDDCYEALRGADALVVATEWEIFRKADFKTVKGLLDKPVVFDCRNLYDPSSLKRLGFVYFGVGRGN